MHVTLDNVDDFYILDSDTGCCLPLFMVVPCGKCQMCKEKKLNEWRTRTFMECQTHEALPSFITLTYKDALLPYDGLHKEEIQLFMKRLRDHCDRYFPNNPKLRFIACGEYGHRTKRPHYHLLIWNLPKFPTQKGLLEFIEQRWPFGFVYVKPTKDSLHGSYICKYMRKDCVIPKYKDALGKEHNCKPCFWLSSRGNGGLGIDWLRLNKQYYQNPEVTDIVCKDKFTGQLHHFSLPGFFKQKLFPTLGRILPKEVRDTFTGFLSDARWLCWYRQLKHSVYKDDIFSMVKDILPKFSFVDDLSLDDRNIKLDSFMETCCRIPNFLSKLLDDHPQTIVGDYKTILERYYYRYEFLKRVEIDPHLVTEYIHNKQIFNDNQKKLYELRPDIDVTAEVYKINERIARQNSKDFY